VGESDAAIDYFMLGTVTRDVAEGGSYVVGGTGAFSAAMAHALGQRVGLCARFADDVALHALAGIEVLRQPSDVTTTFDNRYTAEGRTQYLHARAADLTLEGVPEPWLRAPIVHLGPLAQDLDPALARRFPDALLGVTPQGWLRAWDDQGRVHASDWKDARIVLERASAVVLSIEDAAGDWNRIARWADATAVLVATDAERGAVVYSGGQRRSVPAPEVTVAEPTGAGDLFAAIYFVSYQALRDPQAACARAVWLTSMVLAERTGRFPDAALVQRLLAAAP
jgi:sugar/nucleoside kinase (ribokinase family)